MELLLCYNILCCLSLEADNEGVAAHVSPFQSVNQQGSCVASVGVAGGSSPFALAQIPQVLSSPLPCLV